MTRTHYRLSIVLGSFLALGTAAIGGCDSDSTPAKPSSSSGASGNSSSGSTSGTTPTGDSGPSIPKIRAKATIAATGLTGQETVSGTITFEQTGTGTDLTTRAIIDITGAKQGTHGFHIHAGSNCNAGVDGGLALGAEGHWNPLDAGHGLPDDPRHLGDLGNIVITAEGKGHVEVTSASNPGASPPVVGWTVDGPNSVVGHAVIFHEKADDGQQPVGNAGGRPGCGVIARE